MNNISARKYGFIAFFDTFSGCYFRACRWVTIQCETFCAKTVFRRKSKCCSKAVLSALLFLFFPGAHGVGRRHIKNTLINKYPGRFSYPIPRKYSLWNSQSFPCRWERKQETDSLAIDFVGCEARVQTEKLHK